MRYRILAHVVRRSRSATAAKVLLKVPHQITPHSIRDSQFAQYRCGSNGKWVARFAGIFPPTSAIKLGGCLGPVLHRAKTL